MSSNVVLSEYRGWRRLANLVTLIAMLAAMLPLGIPSVALASSNDIVGPAGSGQFGQGVYFLSNGNLVVRDVSYDDGMTSNVGAIYLYNGATLALISVLKGSSAGDMVGNGGVTVLSNGNFVVSSYSWAADRGAVTWIDGTNGLTGTVSAANSLVGGSGDYVGISSVVALSNGNYVVRSANWSNSRGAVTWGDGTTGIIGTVSSSNSLVGASANDMVGSGGVVALTNDNYVVSSPLWNGSRGAATWGDGAAGTVGTVSSSNSLVGDFANDSVSGSMFMISPGVVALSNGHYVVASPGWNGNSGAATWGDGTTGTSGTVSALNSLVGSSANDMVSDGGIAVLTNGHYVVSSPSWNGNSGAATWGDGTSGMIGTISTANSLTGSAGDNVSSGGVTALSNDNYVVSSQFWNGGRGAVTWGDGASGTVGTVSAANSLTGSATGRYVGSGGVVALTNGNYVVSSTNWRDGGPSDIGAVTWVNGTSSTSATVSPANSLIGSTSGDQIGSDIVALSNGHYVVSSLNWDNAGTANAGAATWGDGTTGIVGTISAANSLIGFTTSASVGDKIIALSNGNYVVGSPQWSDGITAFLGAVTWGDGTGGTSGTISAANSLVGSSANDMLSNGKLMALDDDRYLIHTSNWGSFGAVSLGLPNGSSVGPITSANSVIGAVPGGGWSMSYSYDSANGRLAVGRSDENIVTIFSLDASAPEIAVLGNGQAIADGDSTPSAADGSDFGVATVGLPLVHTFTISNSGDLDLALTGTPRVTISGPGAAAFSVVATPGTPVAPAATTTFQLRFTPTMSVLYNATVSIANDDSDENPYTFDIQGQGIYGPIIVNTSADVVNTSGDCSLREAILAANSNMAVDGCLSGAPSGVDEIRFNIGSGAQTIALSSALPSVTSSVNIDGTTQPGYAGTPLISISTSGTALTLSGASNTTVEALNLSYTGVGTLGTGLSILNSDNITATNLLIAKRNTGITVSGGQDVRILGNDLSTSGRGTNYALSLTNVSSNVLPGGVLVSGNLFNSGGNGIRLQDMTDQVISSGSLPGTTVAIANSSGMSQRTGVALRLVDLDNVQVSGVNLSYSGLTASGTALSVLSNNNLTISNVTAQNRLSGIAITDGSDVWILNNNLANSGMGDNYALDIDGVAPNLLPSAIQLSGNFFGNGDNGLRLQNMSNLLISDGSVPGSNVVISSGDALTSRRETAVRMVGVVASTITKVDMSGPNMGTGLSMTSSEVIDVVGNRVNRREVGMIANNGRDIQFVNNDLTSSGFGSDQFDQFALEIDNITSQVVPGGVFVSGNRFGREPLYNHSSIHLRNIDGQLIGDQLTPGANVVLSDTSGLTGTLSFPLRLSDVSNSRVENLELSYYNPAQRSGTGLDINASSNITVTNITGHDRGISIAAKGGRDIRLLSNDLADSSLAIHLSGISSQLVPGGAYVYGNRFDGGQSGIAISGMTDQLIGNQDIVGANIVISDTSGMTERTGTLISLNQDERVRIDGLDLSYSLSGSAGTAVAIGYSDDVTVTHVLARDRASGVTAGESSDIRVLDNDFPETGIGSYALSFYRITAEDLPGGVLVDGNTFGPAQFGLSFEHLSNLRISDGSLPGSNVVIGDASGFKNMTNRALRLYGVATASVHGLDISQNSGMVGSGVYIENSSNITLSQVLAQHRASAIDLLGVGTVRLLDNDVSGSGDSSEYAVRLSNVTGVILSGTIFGSGGNGLLLRNMTGQKISNGSLPGSTIVISDADGMNLRGYANAALTLEGVSNSTIKGLDLSPASGSGGIGLTIQGASSTNTLEALTVISRTTGIKVELSPTASGLSASCLKLHNNDIGFDFFSTGGTSKNINVSQSWFKGNLTNGLQNQHFFTPLKAENNYWDSPSGPQPSGMGDAVAGNVDFSPFLNDIPVCLHEPIAGLTASNDSPKMVGQIVTFSAATTDGLPVHYTWDFGDGNIQPTDSGTITHIYSLAGLYTASVTASNGVSNMSVTMPLTITDVPISGLSLESDSPAMLGETVLFTSTLSAGSGIAYTWDFGDGTVVSGGSAISHVYAQAGSYTAIVTATNQANSQSASASVLVAQPKASIADVSITEGDSGSENLLLTVTLDQAGVLSSSVSYASGDGSALAGDDYTSISGTLTFVPGETSQTIAVPVLGDELDEPDETFGVTLSSPFRLSIDDGSSIGTIDDNDPQVSMRIGDASVVEGNAGGVAATFPVTLSAASGFTITVSYATSDDTALEPGDYAAQNGTLTFAPGETSQTITVTVNGDSAYENDETFEVTLSGQNNATLDDASGTGTITNDDALPNISAGDVTVGEGDAGSVDAVFVVTLSSASVLPVSVDYATVDGTAVSPGDYTALTTDTLSFAPGETSQTITVTVNGDTTYEGDEIFGLRLGNPSNATIADGMGEGTIDDDDNLPTISIGDKTLLEGHTGTSDAGFEVTLSNASAFPITVDYATADGSATAGDDYTAISTTTLSFAPGETSHWLTVTVKGDTTYENDESFTVELANPNAEATIDDASGLGTITNDDGQPTISVADSSVFEGASGPTSLPITVTLSNPSAFPVSVNYVSGDETAAAGSDYLAASGLLSFAPGETSQTITITINGDLTYEDNEFFTLMLLGPSGATFADSEASGTILNDDNLPKVSVGSASVTEGNSGPVTATFDITLSNPSEDPISVEFNTMDLSATAPSDYLPRASVLVSFAPGELSQTVTVTVNGDLIDENNETFSVNLSSPVNATIADGIGIATITIADDDDPPVVSIASGPGCTACPEGNSGTSAQTFEVTLNAASGLTVTVDYITLDGSAVSGSDYVTSSGRLSFAPGDISETISIAINGDLVYEANESFIVRLSSPDNATLGAAESTGLIGNDEPEPQIFIGDATVTEGDGGTVVATFAVTLSFASYQAISVDYASSDGTALAPDDYTALTTDTLSFAPGESSQTIAVTVEGDLLDELDETFWISLANATAGIVIADDSGLGTIEDNDDPPAINIGDAAVTEGVVDPVSAAFEITLSAPSALPVTVDYATVDGTAQAGSDYTGISTTTLSFAPGETSKTITVTVLHDTLDEYDESYSVMLANPSNGVLGSNPGQGLIEDNDNLPVATLQGYSADEGNSGTSPFTFTVTLDSPSGRPLTVTYETLDDTAQAGSDYVAGTGSLVFAPGETSRTLVVQVNGDETYEDNEAFRFRLTGGTFVVPDTGVALGKIFNDDALPAISLGDVSVAEGDSGIVAATFAVTLTNPSAFAITVDYVTADGTAQAGDDYTGIATTTLSFAPGETSQTISVDISGDGIYELDESFTVELSNVNAEATILDPIGEGSIDNDDALPAVHVGDVSLDEGDSGIVAATFAVTLTNPSAFTTTVEFETVDGTALTGSDYTALTGTLTFAPGQTSAWVKVDLSGDITHENDETFTVDLSNVSAQAIIGRQKGTGTIKNDDGVPSLIIGDQTIGEGNSGSSSLTFTVMLSNPSAFPITVDYATEDVTASAGADYTGISTTTLSFAPGETSQTIVVTVLSDLLDEDDETFLLQLSGESGASVDRGAATGTIEDDDELPSVEIGDATITEGASGSVVATFPITLSAPSGRTVKVDYSTVSGTATGDADYTSASGSVVFAAGETSKTLEISVLHDLLDEDDSERYQVTLSNPSNSTIGASSPGQGAILDNDDPPTAALASHLATNYDEGNSGTRPYSFIITLDAPSGRTLTVTYETMDGSAQAGSDYLAASGSLVFAAGETSKSFEVDINGDTTLELDETFTARLTGGTNVSVNGASATGRIDNDDLQPTISIGAGSASEGDSGSTPLSLAVTLSNASIYTITVSYITMDGAAVAGSDYVTKSGTLSFAPGETSQTITVDVLADLLDENPESFSLVLSSPTNASILDGTGQASILDNDPLPALSIVGSSVTEGDSGTATASFTITLDAPSGRSVMVDYATMDGSALAASDYGAVTSPMLTFAPGETSKTVTVTVSGDGIYENGGADEAFSVQLSSPVNATIETGAASGLIVNDDPLPALSIVGSSVTEGDSGTRALTFSVSLSNPSDATITVSYATSNGTATAGADYTATSGMLSFAPGETSQTFAVDVLGELVRENTEAFTATLSTPVNASIATAAAAGTIVDNDPTPEISMADDTVTEGDSGSTTASFVVTLSNPSAFPISVQFASGDGSAVSPADYTSISGTLSFAPGETSQTISVDVRAETVYENTESFMLTLSSPSNASIDDGSATGTITNDDSEPTVSIADISVTEGNSGTTPAGFVVTLSNASDFPISVQYATGDGSAVAPADYAAIGLITLSFAPGQTSKTITVSVSAETLYENSESFNLTLTNPSNVSINDGSATGTIVNDDGLPTISIDDTSVLEGDLTNTNAVFNVTLSNPSAFPISVQFATSDGTALAPGDYTTRALTTLSFTPGESSKQVTVSVIGDMPDELDETFDVTLSNPSGATIADALGVATILDNDPMPDITITDRAILEGDSGTTLADFTISLSAASTLPITVQYVSSDVTAQSGSDYTPLALTTLSFAPGETSKTIAVTVQGDILDENNETYHLTLSNASNATIVDGLGIGTIVNDDGESALLVSDNSVTELDSGTATITFSVSLSKPSALTVTTEYRLSNGTALAGLDYVAASGALLFAPGQISKIVSATVNSDALDENNETFNLELFNQNNAVLGDGVGVGTILDNDPPPTLTIADISLAEGSGGISTASFSVTLSAPSGLTITLNYATSNGTAASSSDYSLTSGTLTIAPGETSAVLTVAVIADHVDENDETFNLTLSAPVNVAVVDGVAVATIRDDDSVGVLVSPLNLTLVEGESPMTYSVRLNSQPTANVTLTLSDGPHISTDKATLVFTAANWNVAQVVTVSSIDNDRYNGSRNDQVAHALASGDALYQALTPDTVAVTINDDEVGMFIPLLVSSPQPVTTTLALVQDDGQLASGETSTGAAGQRQGSIAVEGQQGGTITSRRLRTR